MLRKLIYKLMVFKYFYGRKNIKWNDYLYVLKNYTEKS